MMGRQNKLSPLIANKEQYSSRSRSITFLSCLFLLTYCSHVMQGGDGNPFVCLCKQLGWLVINSALMPLYEGTKREKKRHKEETIKEIYLFSLILLSTFILHRKNAERTFFLQGTTRTALSALHVSVLPRTTSWILYQPLLWIQPILPLALSSLILSNFLQNTHVPSLKKAMIKPLLKKHTKNKN